MVMTSQSEWRVVSPHRQVQTFSSVLLLSLYLLVFSSVALILLKINLQYQMKIQSVRRRSQLRKRGGNSKSISNRRSFSVSSTPSPQTHGWWERCEFWLNISACLFWYECQCFDVWWCHSGWAELAFDLKSDRRNLARWLYLLWILKCFFCSMRYEMMPRWSLLACLTKCLLSRLRNRPCRSILSRWCKKRRWGASGRWSVEP